MLNHSDALSGRRGLMMRCVLCTSMSYMSSRLLQMADSLAQELFDQTYECMICCDTVCCTPLHSSGNLTTPA